MFENCFISIIIYIYIISLKCGIQSSNFPSWRAQHMHRSHQMGDLVRSLSWCDLNNGEGYALQRAAAPRRGAFPPIVYCVLEAKNWVLEKIYDKRWHEKTSTAALRSATLQAN
jgi:hypothetical protein